MLENSGNLNQLNKSLKGAAYFAPSGFQDALQSELKGVKMVFGRLILTDRPIQTSFWAQNVWLNPQWIPIQSISHASKVLKAIQRNWTLYPHKLHRRSKLIQEKLPHVSARPLKFPSGLKISSLGSWTLWDNNTILAAPNCLSPFPNGEVNFLEDKTGPPNRAYLKLQEVFTRIQRFPKKKDFCIDLGSSPGGWTWVVQKFGARILSMDRSPLDPKIARLPGVNFRKGNAFNLNPESFSDEGVDWLFCDLACVPEKLYDWIQPWLDLGVCKHIICTLKFKGKTNYSIAHKFFRISGSKVFHLFHNKHELTWVFINE